MQALREGQVLRRLGLQESMWHEVFTRLGGTSLLQYSLVVDSERQLEPPKVRAALEAMQRQIPVLRARVEQRDNASFLVAGRCPGVDLTVLPPGEDWLAEHHRQLQEQTIDTREGPLWKAGLLHSPANFAAPAAPLHRAVLYLSLCHTVTDGLSNALICGQLLSNLNQALRDLEIECDPPAPVYPSLEELVAGERVRFSLPLVRTLLRASQVLLPRKNPLIDAFVSDFDPHLPPESYHNQMIPASLSACETTGLHAHCRRHGVSLNAALSAAVSLAGARLLRGPGAAPVAINTTWLVNARRYLPRAERMHLSTVSGAMARVRVDAAPFWQLAARIGGDLQRQLDLKMPLLMLKLAKRFINPEKIPAAQQKEPKQMPSPFAYNINNLGSLDAVLPRSEAVRVVELHRTFKAHPAMDGSFGSHCFHTVGGRLCYDLNFLRGRVQPRDAERFSQLVLELLRDASAPAAEAAA
ncbi:uncharacterized protein LOC119099409 [Pollicipes pollicipes]|uniref:uncharacterized protein LOC119099409 n=1 Tax=Pollicipes pollicipes TaxID=41117 RepID=UPI00188519BA|nr:uncharacterized protein LOC119099409 [Pollicipes pollicipes]XP_037078447.1 uncharacterized protein LOC119099409 [Pollicipes pollicipes]XP_037078448.1 uncharacterized protein LOC119099409 [Pollicipes pollicipes]